MAGWLVRPFRAEENPHPLPRASPWAIILRPFGAEDTVRRNGAVAAQRVPSFSGSVPGRRLAEVSPTSDMFQKTNMPEACSTDMGEGAGMRSRITNVARGALLAVAGLHLIVFLFYVSAAVGQWLSR